METCRSSIGCGVLFHLTFASHGQYLLHSTTYTCNGWYRSFFVLLFNYTKCNFIHHTYKREKKNIISTIVQRVPDSSTSRTFIAFSFLNKIHKRSYSIINIHGFYLNRNPKYIINRTFKYIFLCS